MLKYRKLRREGTYPGALEHKSDSNHKISNLLFGSRKRKKKEEKTKRSEIKTSE